MTQAQFDAAEAALRSSTPAIIEEVQAYAEYLRDNFSVDELTDQDGYGPYGECRLQVMENGTWYFHTGSAQFDTDHTGYWGDTHVLRGQDQETSAEDARQLVDQVLSSMAEDIDAKE